MDSILLVEDDPDIRIDLTELLREQGYPVAAVSNGQEALDWLHSGQRASLILLDLMMPVMNGWDFRARQLREPELGGIPVVLLSGASDVPRHAVALRAAGYLVKPLRFSVLLDIVRSLCGGASSDGAIPESG